MTPVTVDTGARNSYYSAGNVGWAARSLFQYRTAIQQLAWNNSPTLGSAATNAAVAQSFTPGAGITVNEIRIVLSRNSAPTDNLSLELRTDDGSNHPSSTVLGTATNVYSGALMTGQNNWASFAFLTPVALSSGTKYWLVLQRSGAVHATNNFNYGRATSSAYGGGGISILNTGVWGAESATDDLCFQILTESPSALYHVTQDTSLHMWKSTNGGASWTEQDSANAPGSLTATNPFSASDSVSGPYIGTAYFTGTNTITAKQFNMSTDTWAGSTRGTTTVTAGAAPERPIRLTMDSRVVTGDSGAWNCFFTNLSSSDDADLYYSRNQTTGTTWTSSPGTAVLSVTSADSSMFSDVLNDKALTDSSCSYSHMFYYDIANFDFSHRSLTGTVLGTQADLSAAAADVETEQASLTATIYQSPSAVDTAVIAFINAAGTIQERIATLELATVTFAADNAVTTDTGAAGRQLTTCRFAGVNYIFACDGSNIDMYDSTTPGTWNATMGHISGLTSGTLAQAIPVADLGVLLAYTDNGDVKVEWVVVVSGTETFERTVTAVHLIRLTNVRTVSTVQLIRQTATRTVDAVQRVRKIATRTVTANQLVREIETRIVPALQLIRKTETRTITAFQRVLDTEIRLISAAQRILDIEERTIAAVQRIQDTDERVIAAKHHIFATLNRTLLANQLIAEFLERIVEAKQLVRGSAARSLTAAQRIIASSARTVLANQRIQQVASRTVPAVQRVRKDSTRLVPVSHLIRSSVALALSAQQRIRQTLTRTVSTVQLIRQSSSRTFLANQLVRQISTRALSASQRIRDIDARTLGAFQVVRQSQPRTVQSAHRIRDIEVRSLEAIQRIAIGGNARELLVSHRLIAAGTPRVLAAFQLIDLGGGPGSGDGSTGWRGEVMLVEQMRD